MTIVCISGNHDSAERLAFGGRLLNSCGIHLSPVYEGNITPITLADEHGPVDFWLLPFIKPIHVRHCFPQEEAQTYTEACRVAPPSKKTAPSPFGGSAPGGRATRTSAASRKAARVHSRSVRPPTWRKALGPRPRRRPFPAAGMRTETSTPPW